MTGLANMQKLFLKSNGMHILSIRVAVYEFLLVTAYSSAAGDIHLPSME